ncbi:hypothetical protein CCACVL1_15219 [Corchorus capsularis]|uniref:Uncharacterized protein n=1 Tax=Corchorus capsularis TaxID=210143 RepID=A0A1R3I3A2_COCAP|nr:hypothetical protein CCACVL1_15219 [Corchorus capsularis]
MTVRIQRQKRILEQRFKVPHALNQFTKIVHKNLGWEKAMKEVLALKQQLDAATKKHAAVEDQVGHLHGALKKCVRQLKQA